MMRKFSGHPEESNSLFSDRTKNYSLINRIEYAFVDAFSCVYHGRSESKMSWVDFEKFLAMSLLSVLFVTFAVSPFIVEEAAVQDNAAGKSTVAYVADLTELPVTVEKHAELSSEIESQGLTFDRVVKNLQGFGAFVFQMIAENFFYIFVPLFFFAFFENKFSKNLRFLAVASAGLYFAFIHIGNGFPLLGLLRLVPSCTIDAWVTHRYGFWKGVQLHTAYDLVLILGLFINVIALGGIRFV